MGLDAIDIQSEFSTLELEEEDITTGTDMNSSPYDRFLNSIF